MNALTKSFKSASGVLLLSGVAAASLLSSCANENALTGIEAGGIPVKVNVSVPGSDLTRTNLTELNGDLKWEWSDGDRLVATTTDGSYAGTLTLKEITNAEKTSATFEGNISSSLPNGEVKLNFHYVGDADPLSVSKTFSVNYATQNGEFEALKNRDIISTTVVANKTANYCAIPNFQMSHYLSAGHFELIFDDASTEVSSVTISGTGLKNSSVLNLGNCNWTNTDGSISVDPAKKDFYVTLAPAGNLDMVFTAVTTTGKTFEGKMGVVFDLPSGRYLRRKISDSEYVGIPITMTEKQGGDNEFDDPYPDEDPNNPLHIFAKGNLTRDNGETNTFALNGDAGALYQWGRNYGYIDNGGIYENSYMIDGSRWSYNSQFCNFIDAMGNMDYEAANKQWGVMDYFVYCTDPNGQQNGCNITCGTGMHHSNNFYFDQPHFYSSVDDIKANKNRYFMDGTPGTKVRDYGTYLFGMDELNNNADYWVNKFGDGGTTWTARALACGYESGNPCPEGWRLPTEAEMRAIAPEGKGLDSSKGYLSSMLSGYSELRQTPAGIRYAIRWLYNRNAITIEAVVVDESYTDKSQLTTLFWDQNSSKKVVREFPFTGMIRPFIGLCDTPFYQSIYICRPHHFGLADFGVWPLTVGYQNYYYGVVGSADAGDFNPGFGGYWIEEKGVAFKFATRDIASSLAYSCLLVENAEPVSGYAIRPVMDK